MGSDPRLPRITSPFSRLGNPWRLRRLGRSHTETADSAHRGLRPGRAAWSWSKATCTRIAGRFRTTAGGSGWWWRGVGPVPEPGAAARGGVLMAERPPAAGCWSGCQLARARGGGPPTPDGGGSVAALADRGPLAGGSPGADELGGDRADRAPRRPARARAAVAGDREQRTAGKGGGQMAASPDRQYSSGRRIVVSERSASVITQSRSGGVP
jgi:hypothetical protein